MAISKQNTMDMRGMALQVKEIQDSVGTVIATVGTSEITIPVLNTTTFTTSTYAVTNVDAGASGTAGTVDIFPATASRGKTQFTATNNTGDTTTTITNAAQAGAVTYTIPDAGGSASFVMTSGTAATAVVKDLDLGTAAGSVPGTLDIFPTTAARGKIALSCTNNTGDTTLTITNAAQAGAVTYTIPDAGASASFVMTQGAQSLTGVKTLVSGVAASGGFTASPRCVHSGSAPATAIADGTDATPVNTEVYIGECFVPCNMTVTGIATFNGSVASGNYKVGISDSTGAILGTSASTTMSGTDTYQKVALTAPLAVVGPATYHLLLFVDNNTARINTHVLGGFGASKQTAQTYATGFTAHTAPTTFTTALAAFQSCY
jgi:hypothetical protein